MISPGVRYTLMAVWCVTSCACMMAIGTRTDALREQPGMALRATLTEIAVDGFTFFSNIYLVARYL